MNRSLAILSLTLALVGFVSLQTYAADQANPAEAKLREQLRSTMLQLRTMQGERDSLQAEKTQLEADKKAATEKAEALQKQIVTDKDAADKAIAALNEKTASQGVEIASLTESLGKWKVSQAQAVELLKKTDAARADAAQQVIELKRKVADQQTRNLAMYKIAKEILTRYENFGLGTALTAREPFTGTMKVKLENLVQDLGDKVDAERIKPDPAPGRNGKPAGAPARGGATAQAR